MEKNSIEYIANKSKEFLANQINSYRSIYQKAGTVIAVTALFAPLFLFLVEKAQLWVRITAVILILPMVGGIILLLLTLRSRTLNQGYDERNFEDFMNKKLYDVHRNEIAYNKYSIEQNNKILDIQNKRYNWGITLVLASIILSIGLMITYTITKSNNSNNKSISWLTTTKKPLPVQVLLEKK